MSARVVRLVSRDGGSVCFVRVMTHTVTVRISYHGIIIALYNPFFNAWHTGAHATAHVPCCALPLPVQTVVVKQVRLYEQGPGPHI